MNGIKELFFKFKEMFFSRKFILFCIIGTFNTINNAFLSWVYHFLIQENIAAVLGYLSALTVAYFLDSKIVFRRSFRIKRYFKFMVSYIPNFIIYSLVTFITINTMGLPQFWATVLASLMGVPITFVIMKFYTFKKKK